MCPCRVRDAGTERYKAACRNIHVSVVCGESQTATESLNADGTCYLVRRKSSAFLQGHECNPKRSLLDQGFACATSLGRFSKFAERVILRAEHKRQHLGGKPAGPKNTGFFYFLHPCLLCNGHFTDIAVSTRLFGSTRRAKGQQVHHGQEDTDEKR